MYILKNAWKSITRNKGRNILIGIIILVISCSATVALAICNSSDKLIESYENKYDIEATIGVNRQNMMKNFTPGTENKDNLIDNFASINNITLDEIKNYADSTYVSSYYYTDSIGLNGSNIEKATTQKNNSEVQNGQNSAMNKPQMPEGMNKGADAMSNSSTDFKLTGYSSLEAMNEFINGSYTITDGEVSTEDNTCVINSELATLNSINVGDTICLVDSENSDNTYNLIVKGIYKENSESDSMSMFSNSVNTIITTSTTVENMVNSNSNLTATLSPTFILNDKDSVDAFEEELYSKGMNENLTISTNLDSVENATSTILNVKSFATTFLIIVLVIGSIVLFVINAINIRERKYEIGVLRTIGMKKITLTFEFMIELMMVAAISLIMGAAIGTGISVPVSNQLLQSEIQKSETQKESIGANFGNKNGMQQINSNNNGNRQMNFDKVNGVNNVTEFTSINATVDLKVIAELLGIGIMLTMISSLASMIAIQKFSPLTILKERS